jgi:hypothetical protein
VMIYRVVVIWIFGLLLHVEGCCDGVVIYWVAGPLPCLLVLHLLNQDLLGQNNACLLVDRRLLVGWPASRFGLLRVLPLVFFVLCFREHRLTWRTSVN